MKLSIKLWLSLLFKLVSLALTVYGLLLTFDVAASPFEVIGYFTTWINLYAGIVLVWLVLRLVLRQQESQTLQFYRQAAIVFLLVTSIVYSFLLVPYILMNDIQYPIWSLKDLIIHYAVPLMIIFDYVFFSAKGTFRKHYPLLNLFVIVAYIVYWMSFVSLGGTFTLSMSDSIFPYFFLNYQVLGWGLVLLINIGMIVGIILISNLIRLIDHIVSIPLVR